MRAANFFKTAPLEDLRVLRKTAVLALVGLSATHLRNLENAGDFPSRVVLGENSVGWLEKEVREWLAARATRVAVKPLGARAPLKPVIAAKKARGARS